MPRVHQARRWAALVSTGSDRFMVLFSQWLIMNGKFGQPGDEDAAQNIEALLVTQNGPAASGESQPPFPGVNAQRADDVSRRGELSYPNPAPGTALR